MNKIEVEVPRETIFTACFCEQEIQTIVKKLRLEWLSFLQGFYITDCEPPDMLSTAYRIKASIATIMASNNHCPFCGKKRYQNK